MPDTAIPPCEALPAADGPAPAAALSAGIVRRGHNPWWGKDQKNPPPAGPQPDDAAKTAIPPSLGRANLARARTMLDREDPAAPKPAPKTASEPAGARARLRPPPGADISPGLLERLPTQMLIDVAVFATVFTVSCGLMLYLSLYAF